MPIHFKSGGLRRKLLRSFLGLTVFGLVLLCISFIAIFWLRTSTNRLALQRAPGVEAALQARIGIQRSLAGLRGWVALGRGEFRDERRGAWVEDIQPAIARLHVLSRDWADVEDQKRLAGLDPLLADLKESQWWVEDVAQTEGNMSARVILRKRVEPIARTMLSTIDAMIDSGDVKQTIDERSTVLARLSGLQIARMSGDHMLSNFVLHGEGSWEVGFHQNLAVASKAIEQIASEAGALSGDQRRLFVILQQELPWYAHFAKESMAARNSERWNAAQYLMTTETIPLSEEVIARLNALSTNQIESLQREAAYVDLVGQSAVFASIGLIAGMAVIAGLMSSFRARQITQPLSNLSEATRELAAGRLRDDLSVTTDDELGSLTHAFNQMRAALQKSEAALKEKSNALEQLSNQLAKYLSPQVYDSIFSGRQEVTIASRRKKLTVFFSDIVGFTETTDNLEAEELSNLLNHYLTEMSKIALEYGATIDKYIGDAMLLFFGDPESKGAKEDAKSCVMMAIAMQSRMRELEQEWRDRGLERPFRVRIGIATGFCTVGNFGSQDRMDYTIIGNQVNLAARLESSAEPGAILIAHETHSLAKDVILAEEQPPLTVKGFDKPIHCYKVVGIYDDLAEEGRIVRHQKHGIQVFVDPDKLTGDDRGEAIEALKDALAKLED